MSAAVTSVPSLLSVFSASQRCFSTATVSDNGAFRLGPEPSETESSCYPPQFTPATSFFYSPARDCPSGWTVATSTESVFSGSETETRMVCCPTRSYVIQTRTDYDYYETLGCTITEHSYTTKLHVEPAGTSRNAGAGMNAYSIQIRYKAEDFRTTPSSVSQPPSLTSLVATSTVYTTPSNLRQSGGLSAAANAGIGIGIAVGILVLVGLLGFTYRFGKKRGRTSAENTSRSASGTSRAELSSHAMEIELASPQELSAGANRHELPGSAGRYRI